jgi:hypothetical protein
MLFRNDILVAVLTYSVVGFELAFPFLIWHRKTRWIAAAGAVAMHTAIALFMRLVPFAVEAMVFEFILFPDESYRRLIRTSANTRLFKRMIRV